jgi:aminopeptidase N
MTQQPAGFFGQAWPTLIYMPYTAYLDQTQRMNLFVNSQAATDTFWQYVAPHEVAHQWWGHAVGWTSYRDQWMSEGFAEFSASLYVQYVRHDPDKFIDFWEDQRKLITEATPATKGIRPYTIGPVTQGFRLSSGKTQAAYQFLVYPKGAFILHMLRMMMYDQRAQNGDAKFQAMMQDFVKSHYNQDVSTEDLKQIVEKHMTPQMNLTGDGRMDWFFNEYVYGTELPSYRFDYKIDGNTVSGHLTQSGVSDSFGMVVPLYADFGKGWVRLGSFSVRGNSSADLPPLQLPAAPKHLAVAALNDILALDIENKKM